MKWVCWVTGFCLVILSFLALGLGGFVAVKTVWVPTRAVSEFELHRVDLATTFVEAEAKRLGRLPTYTEFLEWVTRAPKELRVDGQGFNYWPADGKYSFSWWDGDASVTWDRDRNRGLVRISPEHVFLFGSKLADLLAFIGAGVLLLMAAFGMIKFSQRGLADAS